MPTTTPRHVTTEFPTPEAAREAALRAESLGFDADAIEVLDAPTTPAAQPAARRAGDIRPVGRVGRRAASGIAAGIVVGVLVGVVVGLIAGDATTGVIAAVVAAVAGGVVGGLAGTYSRLPVDQTAFTADEMDARLAGDPAAPAPTEATVTVRIRVADETEAERARTALAGR